MLVNVIVIFVATIALVTYFIRKVIYISNQKHLFDEPGNNRKIHITKTPNLGGAAIFFTMVFASCLYVLFVENIQNINILFFASLILFLIGLTDDLVGMDPVKKMLAQIVIAFLITFLTDFRINSLYGFFGIYEISPPVSIVMSSFVIIFLVNAFNLIDGINSLAGAIGVMSSVFFAICFWKTNDSGFAYLAIVMAGCLSGFLFYNKTPAKIFLGDTGSLFLGLVMAIFSIRFLQLNDLVAPAAGRLNFASAPALLVGLFIVPVYDTLRVFVIRIFYGKSPFAADRNHIHHILIDIGLPHLMASAILLAVSAIAFTMALFMQGAGVVLDVAGIFLFALVLNFILYKKKTAKVEDTAPIKNSFSRPRLRIIREEVKVSKI